MPDNKPRYFFTNPVDLMAMSFDTQEEAESAAKNYIGGEDDGAGDVTEVSIYKQELVSVVR